MTDKVQKIREYLVGMAGAACCDAKTKKNIEKLILPFIDSLQKEPVSMWHDASKTPIKGKIILVVQYNGFPFLCEVRNDIGYVSLSFDHRNKTKIDENDKWAYIDDLLKM